jgi:hypothetical protein
VCVSWTNNELSIEFYSGNQSEEGWGQGKWASGLSTGRYSKTLWESEGFRCYMCRKYIRCYAYRTQTYKISVMLCQFDTVYTYISYKSKYSIFTAFLNYYQHISVMELGHLLTRSGLTYPEVSSEVYHDSFCLLGSSVSLSWVICFEAFYLHVVSSFCCISQLLTSLKFC